jgi:hypothetical protein
MVAGGTKPGWAWRPTFIFCLSIPISFIDPYVARYVPVLIPGVMRLLRLYFDRRDHRPARAAA